MDWKNLVIDHLNHVYNQMCDTLDGLDPELIRLSLGCEPAEDIIAALAEALA